MKARLSSLREDESPRQFQAGTNNEYSFSEAFARHKNTEINYRATRIAQFQKFAVNLQGESSYTPSTFQYS